MPSADLTGREAPGPPVAKAGASPRRARGARAGAAPATPAYDGFWLPAPLRARLITADTRWDGADFARGRECASESGRDDPAPEEAGAVASRWPLFSTDDWHELIAGLRAAREKAPRGAEYWRRLQAAIAAVARRLADPASPYHQTFLQALPRYTGFSAGMIAATIGASDVWDLEKMVAAIRLQPDKACSRRWRQMPGLPGRVRFYPDKVQDRVAGWLPVAWEMPLYQADVRPHMILAHGAGNVPGDTLMVVFQGLAATLRGEAPLPRPEPPPAVLVGSSREEPLLTPIVLAAIEEADPELVSMVATTVWDYDDGRLQEQLLGEADLVVAAPGAGRGSGRAAAPGAGLGAAGGATPGTAPGRSPGSRRLLAHRREMSFSVIGRDVLQLDYVGEASKWSLPGGTRIMDIVALLAGLDSVFWDQRGGRSSRIHFVERGGPADDLPAEYARRLTTRLQQLAKVVPRGAWPVRHLHDAFDRYKAMEGSDRWGTGLHVMSEYDDPFVVILDERNGGGARLDARGFAALVDECQTRVVVVRPVEDIMEVAWRYLDMVPPDSSRSLSVAMGRPGEGLTKALLDFAAACGKKGVTDIRLVGRGAFPPLAYSWDGFLPIDLVGTRPPGYFTTVAFDEPFEEMLRTYRAHLTRLAKLPATE
jgi:hypothetical protein